MCLVKFELQFVSLAEFQVVLLKKLLDTLALVENLWFILDFITSELYQLSLLLTCQGAKLNIIIFEIVNVLQGSLVFGLEITMKGMHVVQFLLEFQSKLDLLFMRLDLFRELFLDFLAEKLFLLLLFLKFIFLLL